MVTLGKSSRIFFSGKSARGGVVFASVSLLVLLFHWVVIFMYVFPRLGSLGFLRLHYSAGIGVDWIGPWWIIFSFPIFGLVVFIVNFGFARMLIRHERKLAVIAYVATLLTQISLAFGGIATTLLNG